MAETLFAFQCKHCGAVEPADAAGENAVPRACHSCRHGVKFEVNPDGTGFTVVDDPSNWIILADLSDEELAEDFARHGLTKSNVTRHTAKGSPPQGARIEAMAGERVGSSDAIQ